MKTKLGFPHWKGQGYKPGGLLVLAESAYNKQDPTMPVDPEWSIKGVVDSLKGEKGAKYERWHLHFERIFLTVRGVDAAKNWKTDAKDFFADIVYANYIVSPVGNNAQGRPSKAQWDSAWPPFRDFLFEMAPGRVLIFGFGVWGNILDNAGEDISGRKADSETFTIGKSVKASICVIPHPSSWSRHGYTLEKANAHLRNKFGPDWLRL